MSTIAGAVAPGYERVRDAFAASAAIDAGASQLCVYHRGRQVADLWTPTDPAFGTPFDGDRLVWLRSATKGILTICLAVLVDRGLLDVDAPLVRSWPEFGRNGKSTTTLAHVLTHTAGVPAFPSSAGIDSSALGDRARCIRAIEDAVPLWESGTTRGCYHALTFGFIGDEILLRTAGVSVGRFLRTEIGEPLGIDAWIGLPEALEPRVAPHHPRELPEASLEDAWREAGVDVDAPAVRELIAEAAWIPDYLDHVATRAGREPEVSASNGMASARGMARLYAATIGEVDGIRLLSADVLEFFRAPRTRGLGFPSVLTPLAIGYPSIGQGLGFVLDLVPGSFGHGGGGVQSFAIPARDLAVAYTTTAAALDPERAVAREAAWLAGLEGIGMNT